MDKARLEEVMPYIQAEGYLGVLKDSASILRLNINQLIERFAVCDYVGEPVTEYYKTSDVTRFNRVFGKTKSNYEAYLMENGITEKLLKNIVDGYKAKKLEEEKERNV